MMLVKAMRSDLPAEPAITVDAELAAIDSARVQTFDVYWRSKCQGGHLPQRGDIDPAEIKALLPYLLIAEIERTPFRVRYRLDGSETAGINGSITNHYLDELDQQPAEIRAALSDAYRLSVTEAPPGLLPALRAAEIRTQMARHRRHLATR